MAEKEKKSVISSNIINSSSPPTPSKNKSYHNDQVSVTGQAQKSSNAPSTNASSKTYLLFLATCLFVTMTGNVLHHHIADPHNIHKHAAMQFEMQHLGGQHKLVHEEHKKRKVLQVATANGIIELDNPNADDNGGGVKVQQPLGHDMAGLNCIDHNGPSNDVAKEMIYWKDIPSDSKYKSPIGQNDKKRKYLTFEPDGTYVCYVLCLLLCII